jgi:hypothetical protein
MIADAPLTSWAREADALDRNYRLMALGIGLAAAALALPVWLLRVVPWLSGAPGDPNGLRWLGWAGLGLLGTAWAAGLLYPRLRKPAASKAPAS